MSSTDLATLFAETIPRERSGPRSANRFDYQDDWALCKLLELHETGQDYVIVFDYHDDVVVLDSATNPTEVAFFQVKTKRNGSWSRADLVRRKHGATGRAPSILGKLCSNFLPFSGHATGLYFVTNAYSSLKLNSGGNAKSLTTFRYDDIFQPERDKIEASLRDELADVTQLHGLHLFVFENTPLSLDGHDKHALGHLTRFLESLPDSTTHGAPAFYRTLKEEIARRSQLERSTIGFTEICKLRAIDRDVFGDLLNVHRRQASSQNVIEVLHNRLNAEGVPFGRVKSLVFAAKRLWAGRTDSTNHMLLEAEAIVSQHITRARVNASASLDDLINAIFDECRSELGDQSILLTEVEIRALIGVRCIEEPEF